MTTKLEHERGLVEHIIGRPLRLAEQAIDVLALDEALNNAKDDLERAIQKEMVLAAERAVLFQILPTLELTAKILAPLERLFRLGRREALAELKRLGYPAKRVYVAEPQYPELDPIVETVAVGLNGLRVRVHNELLEADLTDTSRDAIARALLNVPGARWIAAEVISSALTAGLSQTFEANQDLVSGWSFSAVLDANNCDPCGSMDGTEYATLDEMMVDLPGFGPYPLCDGGGRCRCRGAPLGPAA